MPSPSNFFVGFRALGYTSNHVPLSVRYNKKHKENYVVTCVGKVYHTYNCSKLGLVSVSDSQPDEIKCLAVDAYLVFTACGKNISASERGRKIIHSYVGHEKPVHMLLPFGAHLISVDEASAVKIWDINSEEIYMEMAFENDTFQITSMVHPNTYLNKVLFGSQQGMLQLWNVRSGKLLYTFSGWNAAVTFLAQAPAVDVIAVGLVDGNIFIHNIRYDETVMKFTQDWGPVTAISFRTDGHPVMSTGSTLGHIALWNLEEKKLSSVMHAAHGGSVTGMQCLPSEPLMVTSSSDNSLKVWIFDQPDGGGRLLRQRSGHSAPPNKVQFHGHNGQNILSAGQDSTLRSFSTVHDSHNKSLGRASFNKAETKKTGLKRDQHMMPPVIDFFSESSRQSDWDSIIACHRGLKEVTTWNYVRSTMGAHRLEHERFSNKQHKNTTALCVTISSCGNFAIIGYSSGHVDTYNMQSGIYRGSYGRTVAHIGAVRAVAVDALNQLTITGGADKKVRFWKFKSKELVAEVDLDSQVSKAFIHRESSMLCVAVDDMNIVIIDIDTQRIVRQFSGHKSSITDMTFSPDGRWLVTASMDAVVRTWDLPTGCLIDCFMVDSPVTSLALSPTGDFLVTTHVDDLGIYIWSNMSLYKHVVCRPLPANYNPQLMPLPSTSLRSQGVRDEDVENMDTEANTAKDVYVSPQQLSDELVTLSLLPNSRWLNLLDLDTIKARNKPKEPPKVPKSAPFFLPTTAGLEPKFDVPDESTDSKDVSQVSLISLQSLSKFGRLVSYSGKTGNYGLILNALKEMGPSAIDMEIRSLAPEAGGSMDLIISFIHAIKHGLQTNQDYEMVQSYLSLVLKVHMDIITTEVKLIEELEFLQKSSLNAWSQLQSSFNKTMCLVSYLKSAAL